MALVQHNLATFARVTDALRESLQPQPQSLDDLLSAVCEQLGEQMTTPPAALLNRSALAAHLGELLDAGEAHSCIEANRLGYYRA